MSQLYRWIFEEGKNEDVHKTILTSQTGSYSLDDIRQEVNKYCSLLTQLGPVQRKRVAFMIPYASSFLSLLLAVNRLGAVAVPISPFLRSEDLSRLLEFINPHVILTIRQHQNFQFFNAVSQWAHGTGEETIIYDSVKGDHWKATVVAGMPKPVESEPVDIIACTSGSTGVPKGVMVDFNFIQFGDAALSAALSLSASDKVLGIVPFSGLFGLCLMVVSIKKRLHFVATESFHFPDIIRLLHTHPVNKLVTSPSLFRSLYLLAKKPVLEPLELIGLAGERITADFIEAVRPIDHCRIISIYGLTEIGGVMFSKNDVRQGMDWELVPGIEAAIVNAPDKREIGELVVKTPNGFLGYYQRPDLTQEAYRDGWFYTGDVARMTESGAIEIVGRKKEMIKKGGQQVIPGEIESLLASHPSIFAAAVVGIPHPIFGEQIVAFVVPKEHVSDTNLYSFCRERLASYKVPDHIFTIDEIPVSQGKADKVKLQQLATKRIAARE
ncbi:class I adenylate-forming enzyme family protein [Geobacillus thermoleovorans]|uniref:class I adenylate-forming enzyme family protein n=1 Tax=Geobacillus thermoleovorans TaxID=33941 RepID=UPI003D2264E2